MLKKVNPMQQESLYSLQGLIKALEEVDLIEIIDESDNKNWVMRFNQTFMRESIY